MYIYTYMDNYIHKHIYVYVYKYTCIWLLCIHTHLCVSAGCPSLAPYEHVNLPAAKVWILTSTAHAHKRHEHHPNQPSLICIHVQGVR